MSIAILGAGRLGTTVARLAAARGLPVTLATSRDPGRIALTVEVLAPGARVATAEHAAAEADAVVLALPLHRFRELSPRLLAGKLVVDAMNYWWEVDGSDPLLRDARPSTSELVAAHLYASRVVKGFNHIGYHDLETHARPTGESGRVAMAVAGDDASSVAEVAALVDTVGFAPVPLGTLHAGRSLEPGHPAFGAAVPREGLLPLLTDPDAEVRVGPTGP